MKKFKLLAVLLISLLIFAGCGSDLDISNPDDGLDSGAEGLVVTGNFINETSEIQSSSDVKSADTETEVGSVVLIESQDYEVVNVEDNEFALEIDRETPSAIAFIDTNQEYLGYLTLAEGMSSFPTQAVDEDTNSIDLGEIDFSGDEAVPEYNPIGDKINLTDSDLNTLSVSDSFFSAVATSPDLINLLIQEEQEIRVGVSYFNSHNYFDEKGDSSIDKVDLKLKTHRIAVHFSDPVDTFENLSLTYPNDPVVGVNDKLVEDEEATNKWVNFPGVGTEDRISEVKGGKVGPSVPESGKYIVDDNADLNFSFYIPELQVAAEDHLIVPLPRFELSENEDGEKMIDSISWEYYRTNGDKIDNPEYILNDIGVQISAHPDKLDQLTGDYGLADGETRIFEAYHRGEDVNKTSMDLRDEEIYWEDLYVVDMAYNDLYGIHYLVPFAHPDYN